MKNHMNRALAILVALLVLCAPVGAMADEVSATLSLGNLSLSIGEDINMTLDVTAKLDLAVDMESGAVTGTLTALAAQDEAVKAGFALDTTTLDLTMGLKGMPDAILVPLGTMLAEAQSGDAPSLISEEDLAKITGLFESYMNLISVMSEKADTLTGPAAELAMVWLNGVMTDGHVGEVTITIEDVELTADEYDFELTVQEAYDIGAALIDAIQADAEAAAALQDYIDKIVAFSGEEESFDLSTLDTEALKAELEGVNASLAGSLYVIDEASFVLDLNVMNEGEVAVPMEFVMLTDEESSYMNFNVDASNEYETSQFSIEAEVPTGDAPKFSFAVNAVSGTDSSSEEITFSLEGDFTEGATLTAYVENNTTYTYGDDTYNSLTAAGLNYTGTMTSDENGISCPGTLLLYVNSDGTEITFTADTLAALNAASTVDFDMPANVINIAEADEDTMNALTEEAMTALQEGLMILMGAPGMENVLAMMQD